VTKSRGLRAEKHRSLKSVWGGWLEPSILIEVHVNQSINQSKRIYIAPYVAGESEARVGLG